MTEVTYYVALPSVAADDGVAAGSGHHRSGGPRSRSRTSQ